MDQTQLNAEDTAPGTATGVETHAESAEKKDKTIASYPEHPLDPLTPDEILAVSHAIRAHLAASANVVKAVKFITCNLVPPPKRVVLKVLGIPAQTGETVIAEERVGWVRRAEVDLIELVTGDAYNMTLSFVPTPNSDDNRQWTVDALTKLPIGTQPQISVEELVAAEMAVRADVTVRKLAAEVGVEPDQIRCDGWAIGYDDRFPGSVRVQQALLFARLGEDENLYAHPLDFIPIIDSNSMKVIHIDFPPHRTSASVPDVNSCSFGLVASTTAPPTLPQTADITSLTAGRKRIPPPRAPFDFLPDLIAKNDATFKQREDVKPLHVVQPEGVSFRVKGGEIEWQKWKMHVAFSHREGVAISAITYNDDGVVRPIFYRLSLAEMVVPYAAPEFPHPRKFAFDAGEYGMGTMANDLTLGCDCIGKIHYLPGAFIAHDGSAIVIKHAICIHEEDAGILWKHSDYRPGGRSQAVRARRLVVSMCCTLANYEYIWNYFFYQDGSIEFEIRLTGILQVYVSNPDEVNPFGTTVAPQVNAHYHQHLFSLRVDPMVDGVCNSVVESDVVPLPNAPTGSAENYAGNAFVVVERTISDAKEGAREYDFEKERRWRVVNTRSERHYASGLAPGYVVGMKGAATRLLALEDGWAARRAAFAKKALWVVRDVEDSDRGGTKRMWPAGKYVPQTRSEPDESVGKWVIGGEGKIDDEDILLFLTLGTTHIPRPEDWPVMPVEHLRVTFKPQSFFKMNPSLDVPGANDACSRAAFDDSDKQKSPGVSSCH